MQVLILPFCAITMAIGIATVQAHDAADPDAEWFKSLRTPTGMSCCGGEDKDCSRVRDADRRIADGVWQFKFSHESFPEKPADGRWYPVSDDKFQRRENPTGFLVICGRWNGAWFDVWCAVKPYEA